MARPKQIKEIKLKDLPARRKDAIALSETYYYTGIPCKHGHLSPRTVGAGCVQCRQQTQIKNMGNYVYLKKYYKKHPMKKILNGIRARAKQNNIEFNLTIEDVIDVPENCPVLDIPLKHHQGRMDSNSPSIDRIDPSKGYTSDNILIVSWRANKIKSNATIQELCKIYKFYSQFET